MLEEKSKTVADLVEKIEKRFGKGAIVRLGDKAISEIEAISTGNLSLDLALGVGGVPKGRIIEIFGPESSGKTTLALHIVAEAQISGIVCAFVDVEHALDVVYAKNLGVDIDDLLVSQPDAGEDALEITHDLIKSQEIGIVVVDSVAALVKARASSGVAFVRLGKTRIIRF